MDFGVDLIGRDQPQHSKVCEEIYGDLLLCVNASLVLTRDI